MSPSNRTSIKSSSASRLSRRLLRLPLVVLLGLSMLVSSGCGTPVIKVDTSPCNRPELTRRAPAIPDTTEDVRAAVKNHAEAMQDYHSLANRHAGLAKCVEDNSRDH